MPEEKKEPELLYCTMRDGFDEFSHLEDYEHPVTIDMECRFSDGQKFGAVTVDANFPELANAIHDFLNERAKKRRGE